MTKLYPVFTNGSKILGVREWSAPTHIQTVYHLYPQPKPSDDIGKPDSSVDHCQQISSSICISVAYIRKVVNVAI